MMDAAGSDESFKDQLSEADFAGFNSFSYWRDPLPEIDFPALVDQHMEDAVVDVDLDVVVHQPSQEQLR